MPYRHSEPVQKGNDQLPAAVMSNCKGLARAAAKDWHRAAAKDWHGLSPRAGSAVCEASNGLLRVKLSMQAGAVRVDVESSVKLEQLEKLPGPRGQSAKS
ncbi:MAG: hypothetical protein U5L72_08370 [Bacteroidales bacterium]|nr:hypothetical protein [Bacteroidales bacterium]